MHYQIATPLLATNFQLICSKSAFKGAALMNFDYALCVCVCTSARVLQLNHRHTLTTITRNFHQFLLKKKTNENFAKENGAFIAWQTLKNIVLRAYFYDFYGRIITFIITIIFFSLFYLRLYIQCEVIKLRRINYDQFFAKTVYQPIRLSNLFKIKVHFSASLIR